MPVDEKPPTASVEAGSKHQVVALCDTLYQFYGAVTYDIDQIFAFELGRTTTTRHI
ncbi:hypothetical protein [Okeania sp. KiyG1]|uniref:hypothetical protein n=1 Tax=Okeania sp. KiyG1 TaxID=2720165 RepID=UPI0019210011|nr:hypothetical protein [Okeania sp. KiyG1]GGA24165.1 hypothetical protein CYANOKiyG1_39680 [Okeania sp. KiyG1]